ncbi:hypothetical protein X777_12085 [Ooceraea biroi]|uniref:Uncharacterized protein n=1 Tax=Ooceraea biroi TaxID=2015173 RepID=A0A026W0J8_OOCBI|nr:hypothetical protein X777_12085 [Ooceraea biroi]
MSLSTEANDDDNDLSIAFRGVELFNAAIFPTLVRETKSRYPTTRLYGLAKGMSGRVHDLFFMFAVATISAISTK